MCGVVLWLHRDLRPVSTDALRQATALLDHRGPDRLRTVVDGHIGVGHTRLSIVGTDNGEQPLFNEDSTVLIACNGEIYNFAELRARLVARGHRFATDSDSEVIVHAYEEDPEHYIETLRGMFGFVLVDRRRGIVDIVRDRIGIKPMFVLANRDSLLCASEAKAILAHPDVRPAIDPTAIWDFLTFGYTIGEQSPFAGIEQVRPGTALRYRLHDDTLERRVYWVPPFAEVGAYREREPEPAAAAMRELVFDAVATHTQGDLPVAVYMSAGIDSVSLAALVGRHYGAARTTVFSLVFDDARYDEGARIRSVVAELGVRAHEVPVRDLGLGHLERAIWHLEQPQIVTLDVANTLLSASARDHGFKAVLGGDGSDELLGGYDHFVADRLRGDATNAGVVDEPRLRAALTACNFPPDFHDHYLACARRAPEIERTYGTFPPWFAIWAANDAIKRPLFAAPLRDSLGGDGVMAERCAPIRAAPGIHDFHRKVHLELVTRLPSWILWKSDRDGMASSIEVRVPYLDDRIVDFVCGVDPAALTQPGLDKRVLRSAMQGIAPASVLAAKKFAFNTPMEWVLDCPELPDVIAPAELERAGIFDPQGVQRLYRDVVEHARGPGLFHSLHLQTLVGVVTTQLLWHRFVDGR